MDDIMAESDEEEETEGVINKVLDEIGIEISGKVSTDIIKTPRYKTNICL